MCDLGTSDPARRYWAADCRFHGPLKFRNFVGYSGFPKGDTPDDLAQGFAAHAYPRVYGLSDGKTRLKWVRYKRIRNLELKRITADRKNRKQD